MATPSSPNNPASDFVQKDNARRLEIIKKQFSSTDMDSSRLLSKELFVQHFLPFFAGEIPPSEQFFEAWNNVAGSPFLPVRITDDDVVIATVPPLTEISQVKPQPRDRRQGTVSDVLDHARMVGALDPRGAQGGIIQKLGQRFNAKTLTPAEEHRQAWVQMLAVFGKALTPGTTSGETVQAVQQDSDPFEFD